MTVSDSWGSSASRGLKVGAAVIVVAAHAAVVAALALSQPQALEPTEPQSVQVRFVEIAPQVEQVQAPPGPQAAPAEAPPPPPPEPQEPPPPEPPPPAPPEPPPPPPPPEPPPKPKPKPPPPPPAPKPPPPKPAPPKPRPEPPRPAPPQPAPVAPAPAPAPSTQPPAGSPDAAAQRSAAPQGDPGPRDATPRLIGTVDYAGRRPEPDYPRISQRMREEGRVVVRVTINVRGEVERAVVQRSSGFERLDNEALKAARQARFRPYTENGVPYPAMADLPFDFTLR